MRILHLSDTHLLGTDEPNSSGANGTESLRQMLTDLRHVRDLGAIVISGDISDDGSLEGYLATREIMGKFASEHDAPLFYTTGNHDKRPAFAAGLGSGHLDPDGGDRADHVLDSPDLERAAVSLVDGYRFVTLDSLVPGHGYGLISQAQLDWLRGVLATPAPRGTVLVVHHPPIALDTDYLQVLGLQNPAELAEAIRDTDVRVILCGHFHLQVSGYLGSTPVWVTPGVLSRMDLTVPADSLRVVRGASATVVELGLDQSPMFHLLYARDPRVGETIYEHDEQKVSEMVKRIGPAGQAPH